MKSMSKPAVCFIFAVIAAKGFAQSKPAHLAAVTTSPGARYFQLAINLKFGAIGEQQATTQTITTEVAVRGTIPGSCKARMVSQYPTGSGTGTKYIELGTKFDANDIHIEGEGVALHFVLSTSRPVKMIKYTRSDGVEMEEPIITERTIELSVKLPLDQPKVVFDDSSSKPLTPLKPLQEVTIGDPVAEAAAAGPPRQSQPMVVEMTMAELTTANSYLHPAIASSVSMDQTPAPKQVHCSLQKPAPLTEADRAFLAGDAAHAESLFAAQVAASPTTANYAGLVKSQLEQNKLPEALATAQKAEAAAPTSAEAESLVGDVQMRSGMVKEALIAYRKALDLDQCSPRAHFGYGKLNDLNAAHATAAHELLYAHKLAPNDPEITAAFLETQPVPQRQAGLQTLLASSPALTPSVLDRLKTEAAILDQHKSCTAVTELPNAKIELLPVLFNGKYARSWGLKTRLNDAFTPLLELDTSVSGIVLNYHDAQKAGVHPLIAGTATGPDASYAGYVDRVHIGNIDYHDCPVRVVPDSAVADSNSLIGTDFFRDHLIHIDYVASLLTLSPLPQRPGLAAADLSDRYIASEEKDWSPVYISGPAVLLPTFINKQGPFLFMLDTGNYRSVISPAVTSSVLTAKDDRTLDLQGSSGSIVKVRRREGGGDVNRTAVRGNNGQLIPVSTPLKLPVYHFTNNEYPDKTSVSFDLSPISHETGTEVSGLLGFGVLRSYYLDVNYRDGLARVLYDQNLTYQTREAEGFH